MPKRRRRLFLPGLVLLTALVGAVSFAYFRDGPDPVGPAGFRRLHKGMTWEEVEAVLGKPQPPVQVRPGVIIRGRQDSWGTCTPVWNAGFYHEIYVGRSWPGPVYSIDVRVDHEGRVDGAALYHSENAPSTVWERVATWVKTTWECGFSRCDPWNGGSAHRR
jgi:hypothetical protein